MVRNLTKIIAVIEAVIIIALLIFLFTHGRLNGQSALQPDKYNDRLLSSRVYSGLLPAESHLIINFKPLEKELNDYITEKNIDASVYLVNLRDGASIGINEDKEFDPLSLNKLPIAIITLQKVESGKLTLNTNIKIKKEFIDSSSGTLYKMNLTELPVKTLLYYMLSESDNTATYTLLSLVSFNEMKQLSNYLNYYNPGLNESIPSPSNNVFITTPKSTYNIFISLYLSTVLSPEHSELILSDMTNTSFDIKRFAQLPENVTVSQKYGAYYSNNKEMLHSCGIIYLSDSRFFYCIMTENLTIDEGSKSIGDILNKIYTYIIKTKGDLSNSNL